MTSVLPPKPIKTPAFHVQMLELNAYDTAASAACLILAQEHTQLSSVVLPWSLPQQALSDGVQMRRRVWKNNKQKVYYYTCLSVR